eukprot:CAMPEP_0202696022 /NCGR_PEP_ID=MMETSP1385-20130828/9412_1 /ASSEMBLY_ACC=CAM_ASM_000861 /TAXON_ID=933848 /ORGANISM="Elphidium margaritaceum" /LENGTH=395 /DNA_ID=CAMNT_0049352117 /DNA_START=71 /DNA_END=1258 /DNA_ORIENTATION=+
METPTTSRSQARSSSDSRKRHRSLSRSSTSTSTSNNTSSTSLVQTLVCGSEDGSGNISFVAPPPEKRLKLNKAATEKDNKRKKLPKQTANKEKADSQQKSKKPRGHTSARVTCLSRLYADPEKSEPEIWTVKHPIEEDAVLVQVHNILNDGDLVLAKKPEYKGTARAGVDIFRAIELMCETNNRFHLFKQVQEQGFQHEVWTDYVELLDAEVRRGKKTPDDAKWHKKASKALIKVIMGDIPFGDTGERFCLDRLRARIKAAYSSVYGELQSDDSCHAGSTETDAKTESTDSTEKPSPEAVDHSDSTEKPSKLKSKSDYVPRLKKYMKREKYLERVKDIEELTGSKPQRRIKKTKSKVQVSITDMSSDEDDDLDIINLSRGNQSNDKNENDDECDK